MSGARWAAGILVCVVVSGAAPDCRAQLEGEPRERKEGLRDPGDPHLHGEVLAPAGPDPSDSLGARFDRASGDPLTSVVCDNIDPANCQERVIINATPHGRILVGEVNAVRQKRFDNFRPSADGYLQQVCIRVEYFNDAQCSLLWDDDMDPMTPVVPQNPNPHDANLYGLLQITLFDDFLGMPSALIAGPFRGDFGVPGAMDVGTGILIAANLNVVQAYTGDSIGFNTPTFYEYGMSATFDPGDEPFVMGGQCYWIEFDYEDNGSTCVAQMSASFSGGPIPTAIGSGGPTDGLTGQGQDVGDRFSITFDRGAQPSIDPATDLRSFDLHMCIRINSAQDGSGVTVALAPVYSEDPMSPACTARSVPSNDSPDSPTVLGPGHIVPFDNTWATFDEQFDSGSCRQNLAEAFESSAGGLWYSFVASEPDVVNPGSGSARIATCLTDQTAGESHSDSIIVVYAFADPQNIPATITSADLVEIGCNDSACGAGLSSIDMTNLILGDTYLVRVHGRDYSDVGTGIISIDLPAPFAENDTCEMATPIAAQDFTAPGGILIEGSTIEANKNVGEPVGCESMPRINSKQDEDGIDSNTVWYSLVGQGHFVRIETGTPHMGDDYDTALAVFCSQDDTCSNLACIGGNDDIDSASSNFKSRLEFCAVLGRTYYICVFGFGGDRGDFALTVEEVLDGSMLPIDCCANGNACEFTSEFEIPVTSINELVNPNANFEACDDGTGVLPPNQMEPDIAGTNNFCNGPANAMGNYQGTAGRIELGEVVDGTLFSFNGGRDIDNYLFEGLDPDGGRTIVDFSFQGEATVFCRTEALFSDWFGCPGLATGLHFGGLEFEGERIDWRNVFSGEFSRDNDGNTGPGFWDTMNFEFRQNINGQGVPCGQRDRYWFRINEALDVDQCPPLPDPPGNPTMDNPMDPQQGDVVFGDWDHEDFQPTMGDPRWTQFGTRGVTLDDRCGTTCTDNFPGCGALCMDNDVYAGEDCTAWGGPITGGTNRSLDGCSNPAPLEGDFLLLRDGVPIVGTVSMYCPGACASDVDWYRIRIGTDADILAGRLLSVHLDIDSNFAFSALLLEEECNIQIDDQLVFGAAGVLGPCGGRSRKADDLVIVPAGYYTVRVRWGNLFSSSGGFVVFPLASLTSCEFNGVASGISKYILTVTSTPLSDCSVDLMGTRQATAEAFEGCPAVSDAEAGPTLSEHPSTCPTETNDGCELGTYSADALLLDSVTTSDAVNGLLFSQLEDEGNATQTYIVDHDYYDVTVPPGEIWRLSYGGIADGPVRFQVADVGPGGSLCDAELFPGTDTRFRTDARGLLRILDENDASSCDAMGAAMRTIYLSEGSYAIVAAPGSVASGLTNSVFECNAGQELTYRLDASIELIGACCEYPAGCSQTSAGDCSGDFSAGALCEDGYELSAAGAFATIVGNGGVDLGIDREEAMATLALASPFNFYGQVYTDILVSDNGLVMLGGDPAVDRNSPAPRAIGDTGVPNGFIAPMWHDWDATRAGEGVFALTSGDVTTIEWVVTRHLSQFQKASFQLVLDSADGSIEFRYGAFTDTTPRASDPSSLGDVPLHLFSAGLEDPTGLRGTTHALDLAGMTSVRYTAGPSCDTFVCCLGNGAKERPGQVDFNDITAALGNWGASYGISSTGPGDSNCDGFVNFADVTSTLANWLGACP